MTMSVFRKMVIGLCVFASMGNVVNAIDNADDLQGIRELAEAGSYQEAMQKLDAYLDRNTSEDRNAQGRFLKGILLSDQERFDDAIGVFVSLTEDYPKLPEPYNNLAVLYAGLGQYLKARDALLIAIKTHPSYATAHENLGDIYAMMATEAYKKALVLDEGNKSAETKLAMIRDLFPKQAVNTTADLVVDEGGDLPARESMAGTVSKFEAPISSASSIAQEPSLPASPRVQGEDVEADIVATLEEWAKAWSNKSLKGYLGFYAPTFMPADGRSMSSWKALRKKRISSPKFISVEISEPRVIMLENNKAQVRFTQKYRSNTYQDTVRKVIEMIDIDDKWRFVREETN